LIADSLGNLYGTTQSGGAYGYGTVFKLDKTGIETVLYSFTGGKDGSEPWGGLVRDAAGNLYGTTFFGGHPACNHGGKRGAKSGSPGANASHCRLTSVSLAALWLRKKRVADDTIKALARTLLPRQPPPHRSCAVKVASAVHEQADAGL